VSQAWAQIVEDIFDRHGLTGGEFDVLAALRRSGRPYTLTSSALARTVMMSRAGMTGRLDRLEEQGLIARALDADDRRSFRISLTARGRRTVDAAVDDHAAVLDPLQAPLTRAERDVLDQNLRRLLRAVDEIRSGDHS
jgi:DNA-binding MarR family transcriptional regulator